MIKINLLPPELQGKRSRARVAGGDAALAGNILVGLLAVVMLAVCVFYGYNRYSKVREARKERDKQRQVLAQSKKDLQEKEDLYGEKMAQWERMKDQEEILRVLMPENRLLWSEKLNMLANLVPEGIYVTQVQVTEESRKVETVESRRRREEYQRRQGKGKTKSDVPEPAKVYKPIITHHATIKAVAVGDTHEERFDLALHFGDRLKDYEMRDHKGEVRRFMASFQPDLNYSGMKEGVLDGILVWAFEVNLTSEPFGFDPEQ